MIQNPAMTAPAATLFLLAGLLTVPCTAAEPPPRPNFVFVIGDDVGADDLGIYGNRTVKTPVLDRLATRAMVFDRAYLTISSCSPSRCSIITGRYPHNTGAPELHLKLPAGQATFVQTLRKAGYHTVLAGKNHMAAGAALGFEVTDERGPNGSENWIHHLRQRPRDQPFFAWFAPYDAHHPFTVSPGVPEYDPAAVPVPPMLADGPGTRGELAGYYHEVSRIDQQLGEVVRELENQGVAGNTYIVFTSDNGRPFPRCKTYLFEAGIRAPLLVSGPGVAMARTSSLVSAIDLAPTILELAGLDVPASVQGVPFTKVLRDPASVTREVAFAERNWHAFQFHERAVRFGDWLYLWNAWPERPDFNSRPAWRQKFPAVVEWWEAASEGRLPPALQAHTSPPFPAEMLFHVGRDPHQFRNLAGDEAHAATLATARALLERWKEETGDSVPADPTPDRGTRRIPGHRGDVYGEPPGASRNATSIQHPGPVLLGKP